MNQTSRVTHQDWTGAEVEVPVMCKLERKTLRYIAITSHKSVSSVWIYIYMIGATIVHRPSLAFCLLLRSDGNGSPLLSSTNVRLL